MKRAKKKKPAVIEATSEAASSAGIEEQPAPSPDKKAEKPRQPPSPGKQLRLQAGRYLKEIDKELRYALKQQASDRRGKVPRRERHPLGEDRAPGLEEDQRYGHGARESR